MIYLFLIWQVEKRLTILQEWKPYLWLSAAGMVMATLVCMGKFNDFAQRVYIPSAFVFYLILLWVLAAIFTKYTFQNIYTKWLLLIVLLGTFEPIKEFIRHQFIDQTTCVSIQNSNADITKMPRFEEFPEMDLSQQYLGKKDSFYYRYCSPKLTTD